MNTHRATEGARVVLDPKVRRYIYAVSIPLIALLVGLGLVDEGTSALVLTLVGAILGVGTSTLAAVNTPKAENDAYTDPAIDA